MRSAFVLGVLLALSLTGSPLFAQNAPPLITDEVIGGTGGKFENIDLANGGVNLTIPVLRIKGRGIDFFYNVNYSSKIWYVNAFPSGFNPPYYWTAQSPWNVGVPGSSFVSLSQAVVDTCRAADGEMIPIEAVFNPVVRFSDGSQRLFPQMDIDIEGTCSDPPPYANYDRAYSSDLSAIAKGIGITQWLYPDGSSAQEDSNGNMIASQTTQGQNGPTTTYTDTLGRTILTDSVDNSTNVETLTLGDGRTITMTYSVISTATSFGVADAQENNTGVKALTQISLPNGTSWQFQYASNSYGQLTKAILPGGGYIRYSYALEPNFDFDGVLNQAVPSLAVTDRYVSPDGTTEQHWSYSYSDSTVNGVMQRVTTQVDPAPFGDYELHTFQDLVGKFFGGGLPEYHETNVEYRQGAGQTLKNVARDWTCDTIPVRGDTDATNPSAGVVAGAGNCRPTDVITTLYSNGSPSATKESAFQYDSSLSDTYPVDAYAFGGPPNYSNYTTTFGNITKILEYDWGPSGSPGPLLRETDMTYLTTNPANGNLSYVQPGGPNIARKLLTKMVKDGSGNLVAETQNQYDGSSLATTSGIQQHDYANYPSSNRVRGNLTQAQRCATISSNSCTSWETSTYGYDDLGNRLSMTDPNANTTSYSYADNFCDHAAVNAASYLTQTTYPPTSGVAHVEKLTYYYWTGLPCQLIDQNGNVTSYSYDNMNRPKTVSYPDGGGSTYSYVDSYPDSVTTTSSIASGSSLVKTTVFDGLGRQTRSQLNSDPQGSDNVDTTYDSVGRVQTVTNPYRSTSDPTYGVTTYSYDALGRTTQVTHPDGSTMQTSYLGRASETSDEGNATRQVQRISQTDGLGRLASVCEVSGSTQMGTSGTPAACGQDIAATGFLTTYGYDALDNLTSVTKAGLNARTFQYDSLSELTSATNPESGTTTYGYDGDGNVLTRVAPKPNQTNPSVTVTTTYSFDALNRLTEKSYNDNLTPTAYFNYDETTAWGHTLTNPIGKLTTSQTNPPGSSSAQTADLFMYDPMGRLSFTEQCQPQDCANSSSMADTIGYDLLGDETSLLEQDYGLTGFTISYGYNAAAELTSVTSDYVDSHHPGTLMSGAAYNAAGELTADTLANGVQESFGYDTRLRLDSGQAGSAYNFSIASYAPNGDILAANDSVNGNWTYSYDDFNRLASASGPGQAYNYKYDRYGNMWQGDGSLSLSFSGGNNHIDTFNYDAAGNLLNDGAHSYLYDAEGRIVQVDGGVGVYVYDALGRRIERTNGSSSDVYLYDPQGREIMVVNTAGESLHDDVYLGSRHLAIYANDTIYFYHSDWLATERAQTALDGTVNDTCTSLPFGDNQSCTPGAGQMRFTGYDRDTEFGLAHAPSRYDSVTLGRFMTPDPSGGHLMNPQSLNRYAYVHNNPLGMIDPTGLDCVYVSDDQKEAKVARGDCLEKNDGGIYVSGAINLKSFNLTPGENGNSLTFNFQSSDTGASTVFQTNLPSLANSTTSSLDDSFGSWSYAAKLFSQVANNPAVQTVSTTRGIVGFYGTSAGLAAGGLAAADAAPQVALSLQEYGPQALAQVDQLLQTSGSILQQIALDPRAWDFVNDFLSNYAPGPVPATLGGLTGFVVSKWNNLKQTGQWVYQEVKESVPHR